MLADKCKEKLINFIVNSLDYCRYEVNGETKTLGLFSVANTKTSFNVKVYFDDTVYGTIRNVCIVDKAGDVILINDNTFTKPAGKSLTVTFNLVNLQEVVQ